MFKLEVLSPYIGKVNTISMKRVKFHPVRHKFI